jgi:hypothetical protein
VLLSLLPLILGGLLSWTGGAKLSRRRAARQAAGSALEKILADAAGAVLVLRVAGAVEVVLAAALLLRPPSPVTGFAVAGLGACFAGYLAYARAVAPGSSCGCTSQRAPAGWRSITRALVVAAGGAGCAFAKTPWWSVLIHRPAGAAALAGGVAVALALLTGDPRHWLLPLRRTRLRLLGHPLAQWSGEVPVAASVELLESSLAWQAARPIVRSALIDHWDSDGWRILRYSGVHDGAAGARPVSVVFALDAHATSETTENPVVRVSVVDEQREELIPDPLPGLTAAA